MPLYPFTPTGVNSKITAMYALTDAQLLVEAEAAASDFVAWLQANFSFDTEQLDYLSIIPANVSKVWGYLSAATFIGRGSVGMGALPSNNRRIKETECTSGAHSAIYVPPRDGQPAAVSFTGGVDFSFVLP